MNDADKPFESPKLLIARAKENIDDFDARYKAFLDTRPYDMITEDDPKTGDRILKIKMLRPIPPILRAITSDALNNMRHALDQAVNDAAISLRGGARNCYFPFGQNAKAFAVIYDAKRYKTIPVDLRPHLNALEPYFGGNELLYALGKLSGPNKHQIVLRLVGYSENLIEFNNLNGSDYGAISSMWDLTKGELAVLRVGPKGHVNADMTFRPCVAIQERAVAGLKTPGGVNEAFLSLAESIVLGIETETARLLAAKGQHGHSAPPAG